jgi:hypothetical protein
MDFKLKHQFTSTEAHAIARAIFNELTDPEEGKYDLDIEFDENISIRGSLTIGTDTEFINESYGQIIEKTNYTIYGLFLEICLFTADENFLVIQDEGIHLKFVSNYLENLLNQ